MRPHFPTPAALLALVFPLMLCVALAGCGTDRPDVLRVTGNASLGGTLDVSSINGFTGSSGNTFDVLTYGSRTGDFATRNVPPNTTFQFSSNPTFYRLTRTTPLNMAPANVQTTPANNAVTGNNQLFNAVALLNDQNQQTGTGTSTKQDAAAKKKAEEEAAAKKKAEAAAAAAKKKAEEEAAAKKKAPPRKP